MRILLVEDDRELASYTARGLEEEGNRVTVCHDGSSALRAARGSPYDILVLDVMLPFLDGIEVTRRLRAVRNATPIVLLTARDAPRDIVRGLDAGADDYLTKPFSFEVLLARLRARTRAADAGAARELRYADLRLDAESHEAWRAKSRLNLTRTEFAIVECLMRAAGRVVPRARLIETVWGHEREIASNTLDVFIRFLRLKIDDTGQPRLIHTVRGIGYCLKQEAS
jgi:two-component system response regulator MprA